MSALFLLHGAARGLLPRPELTGACNAPVEVLISGEWSILASPAGEDAEAVQARFSGAGSTAELALAHNRILASVAPTLDIAPIALGAVVTLAGLPDLLAARAATLESALARIAGCVEFGAKLFPPQRPDGVESLAPAAPPPDGRAYLQRLQRSRQQRRSTLQTLEEFEAEARTRLSALAQEVLELPAGPTVRGRPLMSLALLVARAHGPRLEEAAGQLFDEAQALGLGLEVSGPWPAYSFTGVEAGEAA